MKQLLICLIAFIIGAVVATLVLALFVLPVLYAERIVSGGTSTHWPLQAFETINRKIPEIVNEQSISMTVAPVGNGYCIIASDNRLRARFGITSWDRALKRIDAEMLLLQKPLKQGSTPISD